MKKQTMFFWTIIWSLFFISCSDDDAQDESQNVDIRIEISSEADNPSIITTEITDGSVGDINILVEEEEQQSYPYSLEFSNQKINYHTIANILYQDREVIPVGNSFEEYHITMKLFIDGVLKEENTILVESSYDRPQLNYAFQELYD